MTSEHGCSALDRGRSPCAGPTARRGRTLGPSAASTYFSSSRVSRLAWITSPERGRPALCSLGNPIRCLCNEASLGHPGIRGGAFFPRPPSHLRRRFMRAPLTEGGDSTSGGCWGWSREVWFLGGGKGRLERERGIVEKALRRGEIFFIGIWIVRSDLVSRIWLWNSFRSGNWCIVYT